MAADLDRDMSRALVTERELEAVIPAMRELPAVLPHGDHLSNSSLMLLWRCPEKWRRRYLAREYEPPSGAMIVGSCTGAAARVNFEHKIETGEDLDTADVLDAFADEWNGRAGDEDIDWGTEKPERIRESGQAALSAYHRLIAPGVRPVTVERQFTLRFEGVEWTFTGYLDLEESDGAVGDLKCKGKRLAQANADADSQPASYLLARRAEGKVAPEFRFHTMIRTAKATAEVVRTIRTDEQLDAFLRRIFSAAAEIAWRTEYGEWSGAVPDAWWCSARSCGYHASCPMGGAR